MAEGVSRIPKMPTVAATERCMHDVHFAQRFYRIIENENAADEGQETPSGKVSDIDVKQGHPNTHCRQDFDQRPRQLRRFDHAHGVAELEHGAPRKTFYLVVLASKGLNHANAGERFLHRHHHLSHVFLLALHRLAGAAAKDLNGHDATGEEDERRQGKFPIHVEQNRYPQNDRDRLFKGVAADLA